MLTIIIPVYNSKKFILQTLESLEHQTFRDFMVLFIDDGSEDDSGQYIDGYFADKDIDYQIIYSEHQGVSAARNLGLVHVNTPYVMFMDSDDIINSQMIEKLISCMLEKELDAIYCGYDHIKGGQIVQSYKTKYTALNDEFITGIDLLDKIFNDEVHIITSSVIYRSDLMKDMKFDEKSTYHEDLDFYYRVLSKATKVSFYNESLVYYVMREDSLSHDLNLSKLEDGLYSLGELYHYLKKTGHPASVISKIYTRVIPRTLFVFYSNLCVSKTTIRYFKENGYFKMMRLYSLNHFSRNQIILMVKIRWISIWPSSFRRSKILYGYINKLRKKVVS